MSSEAPLVSVIVPVRNGERLVGRSLASAVAQTYRHIEIVAVDDGSTDRTVDLIEEAATKEKRIRLFRRPHSGVSAARNFGISQARGDFIAPLDADDLWHPEKIARQVAAMHASPKIGLVYCWAVEIDEDDFIISAVRNGSTARGNVLTEMVAKAGIIPSGGNPLIRRSYFEAVGGYDTNLRYAEDWKFYLLLAEICEFAVVPAHLVGYRRSPRSASQNVAAMAGGMEAVSSWIVERWPSLPKDAVRQMIYYRNEYLAHLALINDQFVPALRFKMSGYKARPSALLTPETLVFGARIFVRLSGIKQFARAARQRSISFKAI